MTDESHIATAGELNAKLKTLLRRAHDNGVDVEGGWDCRNGESRTPGPGTWLSQKCERTSSLTLNRLRRWSNRVNHLLSANSCYSALRRCEIEKRSGRSENPVWNSQRSAKREPPRRGDENLRESASKRRVDGEPVHLAVRTSYGASGRTVPRISKRSQTRRGRTPRPSSISLRTTKSVRRSLPSRTSSVRRAARPSTRSTKWASRWRC